jgi:hypothetical protein
MGTQLLVDSTHTEPSEVAAGEPATVSKPQPPGSVNE